MPERYSPQDAAALFAEDAWFKSPKSTGGNDGEGCVEVNFSQTDKDMVGVRDSKQRDAGVFVFHKREWGPFVDAAKEGLFDWPA